MGMGRSLAMAAVACSASTGGCGLDDCTDSVRVRAPDEIEDLSMVMLSICLPGPDHRDCIRAEFSGASRLATLEIEEWVCEDYEECVVSVDLREYDGTIYRGSAVLGEERAGFAFGETCLGAIIELEPDPA